MLTPKQKKEKRLKMKEKVEKVMDSQGEDFVPEYDFYLDLPEGTERWFPSTGKKAKDDEARHFFNIIPYWVGPNYPTSKKGGRKGRFIDVSCNEDDLFYKLDIWYHKNVGKDNLMVPCPSRNYDDPCPICEWINEEYNEIEDEKEKQKFWSDHGPKKQNVFNVKIVDEDGNPLEDDKIFVFNIAEYFMDERLKKLSVPARGARIYYADEKKGRTIFFTKTENDEYGYEIDNWELVPRDYDIDEADADDAVCLDKYIKQYSYEEIKELHEGKTPQRKSEPDPETENEPEPDEEAPQTRTRTRTRTKPKTKDKPSPKPKNDDPHAEFKTDGVYTACPEGSDNFGTDWNKYEQCDGCPAGTDCKRASIEDDVPF